MFRGLDEKAAPKLGAVRSDTPVAGDKARQQSRVGKRVVSYYLDPEPFVQLKMLAAKTGVTVQNLNLEALDLLFEKHGVSRIAR